MEATSSDTRKAVLQRCTLPYDNPVLLPSLKVLLPFGGSLSEPLGSVHRDAAKGRLLQGPEAANPLPGAMPVPKPPARTESVGVGQDFGLFRFLVLFFVSFFLLLLFIGFQRTYLKTKSTTAQTRDFCTQKLSIHSASALLHVPQNKVQDLLEIHLLSSP